ncbi:MAG: acyl carrier protein [Bacteroidaceae bacterium]|jgi:acyl carrier protein|nr:acyl carrier protein [Bacteroidaceae bacterium]
MDLNEFLENFANLFDDTDASEITADCHFRELDEYSSLIGMSIIAMARTEYEKSITGADIRSCTTVEDLFNLINNK